MSLAKRSDLLASGSYDPDLVDFLIFGALVARIVSYIEFSVMASSSTVKYCRYMLHLTIADSRL